MGRLLDDDVKNILWIKDPVSRDRIGLCYHIPTTEEKRAFYVDIWDREKNRVVENLTEARIKWGSKILDGFTDGSFEKTINGKRVMISCDPASPDYYPEWKEWILKKCPDLLERLCLEIFEGFESEGSQEVSPEKK